MVKTIMDEPEGDIAYLLRLIGKRCTAVRVDGAGSFFSEDRGLRSRITELGYMAENAGVNHFALVNGYKLDLCAVDEYNIQSMMEREGRDFHPPNIITVHNPSTVTIPMPSCCIEYSATAYADPFTMRRTIDGKMRFEGKIKTVIFGAMSLNMDLELLLKGLHDNPVLPSKHTEIFNPVLYLRSTAAVARDPRGFFAVYSFSEVKPVDPFKRSRP